MSFLNRFATDRIHGKPLLRLLAIGSLFLSLAQAAQGSICFEHIPARPTMAPSGTAFAKLLAEAPLGEREPMIVQQILSGNVPKFLRKASSITLQRQNHRVTFFTTPDYLAIGSDQDFIRIPMNRWSAEQIVQKLGCHLPTTQIVDDIYAAATTKLTPKAMNQEGAMTGGSIEAFKRHNQIINRQVQHQLAGILAGHKKDIVQTRRLREQEGRIAIYGWHRPNSKPIQPLSLVHGAFYVDYSHGVRLIADKILIDGKSASLAQILKDPVLYKLFTKEPWLSNDAV